MRPPLRASSRLLVVLSVATGLTQSPAPPAAGQPPPIPFVDAHVHLNDEALQLELMKAYGATQAVIFWGRDSDNESVAETAGRRPDQFIAFASISPERTAYRPAWSAEDPAILARLDALLATGKYRGIGEISAVHFPAAGFAETDFSPVGAIMTGVMGLARKYRVPVLVHIELTRMPEFSKLLETYRDVPVIWAHGGYTPLFLAARMLERHPNLYYELSARTWPRHPRSPDYTILRDGQQVWPEWLRLIESRPGRFLIGSDASHRSRESEIMKLESVQAFLRQLTPPARDRVARQNILELVAAKPGPN